MTADTIYTNKAEVTKIVEELNAESEDWTYSVKQIGVASWKIEVWDETGEFLGYL